MVKTVLAYGDSNTHGTLPMANLNVSERIFQGGAWPDVMAAKLGDKARVIAEGLPGRTTVLDSPTDGPWMNGLTVLPAILKSHKPVDLLLIMLGTNDLQTRFGYRARDIQKGIEALIKCAKFTETCADIMIISPVPVLETGSLFEDFAGAEERQKGLASKLADLAGVYGCGFFDAGTATTVSEVDGVHMDVSGQEALGQAIANAVEARLFGATD